MGQERWGVLVLLLLFPPAVAELLSASAPPSRFFHPIGFLLLTFLYGGGVLLIREARARWGLQWPVLLLAIAYGVLEEGTIIQSFFNHNHVDLHALTRYGMVLGVQWPWTIMVTAYHVMISVFVPLAVADMLWPHNRNAPLLKKRGIILATSGVAVVTLFFWVWVWVQGSRADDPYTPNPLLLLGSELVVGGLVFAAWRLRKSRIVTRRFPLFPPFVIGLACFLAQPGNLIVPNALVGLGAPGGLTVLVQLAGVGLALLFAALQLCHRDRTPRHVVAAVTGTLFFYILLTPVQEFGQTNNPDPTQGMLAVGVSFLAALFLWRRWVLRRALTRR